MASKSWLQAEAKKSHAKFTENMEEFEALKQKYIRLNVSNQKSIQHNYPEYIKLFVLNGEGIPKYSKSTNGFWLGDRWVAAPIWSNEKQKLVHNFSEVSSPIYRFSSIEKSFHIDGKLIPIPSWNINKDCWRDDDVDEELTWNINKGMWR
jgi:hypothetical protein